MLPCVRLLARADFALLHALNNLFLRCLAEVLRFGHRLDRRLNLGIELDRDSPGLLDAERGDVHLAL
jgi:hypothetical protein